MHGQQLMLVRAFYLFIAVLFKLSLYLYIFTKFIFSTFVWCSKQKVCRLCSWNVVLVAFIFVEPLSLSFHGKSGIWFCFYLRNCHGLRLMICLLAFRIFPRILLMAFLYQIYCLNLSKQLQLPRFCRIIPSIKFYLINSMLPPLLSVHVQLRII